MPSVSSLMSPGPTSPVMARVICAAGQDAASPTCWAHARLTGTPTVPPCTSRHRWHHVNGGHGKACAVGPTRWEPLMPRVASREVGRQSKERCHGCQSKMSLEGERVSRPFITVSMVSGSRGATPELCAEPYEHGCLKRLSILGKKVIV